MTSSLLYLRSPQLLMQKSKRLLSLGHHSLTPETSRESALLTTEKAAIIPQQSHAWKVPAHHHHRRASSTRICDSESET
ncbi:hypothetical protein KC19_6G059600 [Ceratodon purpureus]|uniref:Uncharacterized protein n=1 Tax=Ceratodon purpureus TaxID=3225 RepID=A0A8T0HG20_CERPU|nr:hypothetical protein KC19_6G059600 [Ceratodon purpureus]